MYKKNFKYEIVLSWARDILQMQIFAAECINRKTRTKHSIGRLQWGINYWTKIATRFTNIFLVRPLLKKKIIYIYREREKFMFFFLNFILFELEKSYFYIYIILLFTLYTVWKICDFYIYTIYAYIHWPKNHELFHACI